MWRRRILDVARSLPVRIAAGLYVLYLLFGFFLVDPLAHRLLPWFGERMLASRLAAQQVTFNPFTLELRVRGLVLSRPDGGFLAGFDRLYVNLEVSGLARWAWRVRSIELDGPRARFEARRGGGTNWSALLAKLNEHPSPPSRTMARLLVDHVRVAGGEIAYVDADRPGAPFQTALKPLRIELEDLSTLPEDRGGYQVAARLPDQGATLRWKGQIGLNPLLSEGDVALEGARIDQLAGAFGHRLAAVPAGTLGAQLHYRFAMLRAREQGDVPDSWSRGRRRRCGTSRSRRAAARRRCCRWRRRASPTSRSTRCGASWPWAA